VKDAEQGHLLGGLLRFRGSAEALRIGSGPVCLFPGRRPLARAGPKAPCSILDVSGFPPVQSSLENKLTFFGTDRAPARFRPRCVAPTAVGEPR
jgi:hypothetical protein